MARHREVDVAGELDEAVDEVELARSPGQVVRVDRDAVPADARAGREAHEPERLGRGGVDDLPDVEAHPLAQQGELVDERDVDVAEDVLEQLGQLGRVGRGHLDDVLVDVAQQRGRACRALRRRGADEPRDALAGARRIARVDPLGGEREVEVGAGLEPAALEDLAERAGRRARERRRLEDDQLTLADGAADGLGGGQDRREVRVLGRRDRRRDADEDRVGVGQVAAPRATRPPGRGRGRGQALVRDVVDRARCRR